MSECCSLYRLNLCPDCADEAAAAEAAYEMWIDNQIKWEQEERLLGAER